MNGLFEHIQYLLVRHNCVVLPTLGAFLRRHCPARIDEERGCIIPPEDEISFNEAIVHDDALLASSVARKLRIPYQEALLMVYDAIAEIKVALAEEGEVTIGNIGTLRLNDSGKLIFAYLDNSFNNPSRIGFLSVGLGCKPAARRNMAAEKPMAESTVAAPAATSVATPLAATLEPVVEEEHHAESENDKENIRRSDYYYITINKKVARYAVMAILFICVTLSTVIPLSNQTNVIDRASVLPIDTMLDSAKNKMPVSGDPVQESVSVQADAEQMEARDEADTDTQTPAVSSDEDGRYQLIVATFATRSEADRFIETHSQTPYQLHAVASSTLCRVSAKGSDNSGELYALLSKEEFKKYFREAWVWKK